MLISNYPTWRNYRRNPIDTCVGVEHILDPSPARAVDSLIHQHILWLRRSDVLFASSGSHWEVCNLAWKYRKKTPSGYLILALPRSYDSCLSRGIRDWPLHIIFQNSPGNGNINTCNRPTHQLSFIHVRIQKGPEGSEDSRRGQKKTYIKTEITRWKVSRIISQIGLLNPSFFSSKSGFSAPWCHPPAAINDSRATFRSPA